jgi:hypothetical protein
MGLRPEPEPQFAVPGRRLQEDQMAGTTSARPFAILGGERFDQAYSPIFVSSASSAFALRGAL